ncbi:MULTISPECIES: MotA/TolQ/ExbB proton channel family protein [unclassified Imperialibacter]|uniref:MotA/TolQ/ExbB proton channel family protein n=1 Tax=unclassified Imperialibacter TaxID=2629706 RepID=UPI001258CFFB
MFELFWMGGIEFMSVLTLMFLAALIFSGLSASDIFSKGLKGDEVKRRLDYVKFFGLLALVTGVLGQLIGMFMAFQAIEQIGEVSQAMLAGGLKVSSITSIYGMLIFVITRLIWFGLHYKANK